jgi:hypothetical protein
MASFGVASSTLPLGFTNIGTAIRLKYRVMYLEDIVGGVILEFVFH